MWVMGIPRSNTFHKYQTHNPKPLKPPHHTTPNTNTLHISAEIDGLHPHIVSEELQAPVMAALLAASPGAASSPLYHLEEDNMRKWREFI
ncbi:hypothetical protein ACLOJK_025941 [Asimina triloba]